MKVISRVAYAAAPLFCLLGAATISVPSFASEAPDAPAADSTAGSTTAMLAAVTGPLAAADVRKLEAPRPDFSTPAPDVAPAIAAAVSQPAPESSTPESLADLVADHATADAADDDVACLATTVYYESKGEPLLGQLAVAQTILNRTRSGRFPSSVCGVVKQRGQFSFLRGGQLPTPPQTSSMWQTAVAIALIARDGLWKQAAPDALFFHATRVSPGWGKTRVALLGHHIFFR